MTTTFKYLGLAVIVVAIALIAFLVIDLDSHDKDSHDKAYGATSPSVYTASYSTESVGGASFVLGNALTGPYSTGTANYLGQNQIAGGREALLASSTAVTCAIQNPFNATSTIMSFGWNPSTGTSTPANGIDYAVGTTTSPSATSTSMISDIFVGAGKIGSMSWDPGVNNGFIAPNAWITVGALASSTITGTGGISLSGTCYATIESD